MKPLLPSNSHSRCPGYCFKILKFLGTWAVLIVFTWFCLHPKEETDVLRIPYPSANVSVNTSKRYLSSNLASICQLGNHIFEFVSLYGLSKRLNRTPVFFIENGSHRKMLEKGKSIIPGLVEKFLVINGSVPHFIHDTSFQPTCCSYDDPVKLEHRQNEYLHLSGMFYQSWKYFANMKEELTSYLDDIKFMNFGALPRSNPKTQVTCAHARRGDFLEVGFYGADPKFIRSSLKFVDTRENSTRPNRKVVLFGDDLNFLREVYPEAVLSTDKKNKKGNSEKATYYISGNSPNTDLIYSKHHCDVVVISASHSTFGWWMGYFSKGNKVYYMDIQYTMDSSYVNGDLTPDDFFPPSWTPLKFAVVDNFTVIEST